MKLAKLILASSLVASCAFAEGVFVGVVGGYNFMTKIEVKETDLSIKDKNAFFGVKGGYDFGAYRAYGQYNYNLKFSKDYLDNNGDTWTAEFKGHEFLVGADWTPSINENLKLAVGPYLGYSIVEAKDIEEGTGYYSSDNISGFVLGGKVGAIFDTGVGEFEAGVKADKTWYDETEIVYKTDKTTVGLYLGYNFKF